MCVSPRLFVGRSVEEVLDRSAKAAIREICGTNRNRSGNRLRHCAEGARRLVMTPLESIAERLGTAEAWAERGGVLWLCCGPAQVRTLAEAMNDQHARFATITAHQLPGNEGFRLEYLWDLDGRLLGFAIALSGNSIDTICDLCEAADWIEREIHDGFAVEFAGRTCEPLLLRPGDKPGVNLREAPQ